MKFYNDCTICGRRIIGRSVEGMNQLLDEHEAACASKRVAERRAARAAAGKRDQLELFPTTTGGAS